MTHTPVSTSLPILDMSMLDGDEASARAFRDALRTATHDVGFFYLTGTGIPPELEARLHRHWPLWQLAGEHGGLEPQPQPLLGYTSAHLAH